MLLQTSQRQRGECGTFSGGRKTFREVCGKLSGGHKSFREVCGKLSGGHKTFRGLCGAFSGVPETSAECAARFRGSRKPARSVRHVFGGPGNQCGLCGSFSGVPEDRPKFHFSAFSIQKLQRKTRFQDSALQYFYGKSSVKAPFPS